MLFYLLKYALSNFRTTKHHSDFVRSYECHSGSLAGGRNTRLLLSLAQN